MIPGKLRSTCSGIRTVLKCFLRAIHHSKNADCRFFIARVDDAEEPLKKVTHVVSDPVPS